MDRYLRFALTVLMTVALPALAETAADEDPLAPEPGIVKFEVPLTQLSNLPIFGGYAADRSDTRNAAYIEPICQALGYEFNSYSQTSWSTSDQMPEVTVYDSSRPSPHNMQPEAGVQFGYVSRLVCGKQAKP